MAKALLLFLFLTYFGGVDAQVTMIQPPSMSASIGETVRITCRRSSGSISSNYNSWYQQKPGSTPILLIYRDSNRASGISDRFSGSLVRSANAVTLTITNVQAEDEADYYCFAYLGSNTCIFGSGTTLSILGQAASPPTVNLFPPSAEERQSKNKATLVCLMDGFIPGAVTVTWQADGTTITNGVETTKPTKVNDKYMAASYLSMDKAEWELREKYSCKVTHAGTEYSKAINRSQCA